MYNEIKEKINIEIEKLEKASTEKLKYLETQAIIDIQNKMSNKAIEITEDFLTKNLDQSSQSEIINNSIAEIENTLSKKNKFIQ